MLNTIDMHMHLGFATDVHALATGLVHAGVEALSCTVTPEEYDHLHDMGFGSCGGITLALGLHPWYVDGTDKLPAFLERVDNCDYIGEIGLDFSAAHAQSREEQLRVLNEVLRACAHKKGALFSIHAVRTKGELVDAFVDSGVLENCICILHSFAGSSDELKRAIDAGFYFSVGPRMLANKRGREYARIIPEAKLLLETDLPAHEDTVLDVQDFIDSLENSLCGLAEIRLCGPVQLAEQILDTSKQLLCNCTS